MFTRSKSRRRRHMPRKRRSVSRRPKPPRSTILVQVLDLYDPDEPYRRALNAARDYGGPWAIERFKAGPGKAGRRHEFTIRLSRLPEFIDDVRRMVTAGRLKVFIDGHRMRGRRG